MRDDESFLERVRDWRNRRRAGRRIGHVNSDRREWARDAAVRRDQRQPQLHSPVAEPEWVRRMRDVGLPARDDTYRGPVL